MINTHDEIFVHTVEELIDFIITEIEDPLNLIPEMLADDVSEPEIFSEEEFNSESEDMEDKNDHNEERGNPPLNNQPCLSIDALAHPGPVHNLPQHP
jgi:hypothetical protein